MAKSAFPPESAPAPRPPPLRVAVFRTLARLLVIVLFAVAVQQLMRWAEAWLAASQFDWAVPWLTFAVLLIYALLIAIPFVPGVEIGLSLLMINGADVAPAVWLATTLGLSLAYMVGCKVPFRWLHRVFLDLHMTGACQLLERFEQLPLDERVNFLISRVPRRWGKWVVKYRYLNLAILINIPGNALIGGGGGIALISGMSGVFRAPQALLTIALATAPVPLVVWLFGWKIPWY